MDKLIIRLFVDEDFDALNNTIRWNGKSRITNETVAHHTYLATVFARVLIEDFFDGIVLNSEQICIANLLKLNITTKTLFHDFDETITGDVIHTVKYNSFNGINIRNALDSFVKHSLKDKFDMDSSADRMIYDAVTTHAAFEKRIVKLCDWLSVLFYMSKEMSLGNKRFKQNWDYGVFETKKLAKAIYDDQENICELYGLTMNFDSISLLSQYDYEKILNNWE